MDPGQKQVVVAAADDDDNDNDDDDVQPHTRKPVPELKSLGELTFL